MGLLRWRKLGPRARCSPCPTRVSGLSHTVMLNGTSNSNALALGRRCGLNHASDSLAALQRILTLLRVAAPSAIHQEGSEGRATTALALPPGLHLADIMRRSDWRSGSVLAYVRPDDVHVPTFVAQTLDMSDAEADE